MLDGTHAHFGTGETSRCAAPYPPPHKLRRVSARPSQSDQVQAPLAIRLAESEGCRRQANALLNRMYGWRGYGSKHKLSNSSNRVTFTAAQGDDVVGTLTLAVDTAAGLAVDQTFERNMKSFRAVPGARLCELTKFAFDPAKSSKPALAALFHTIFIYGSRQYGCTDLFIEVNPRHVRFYEMMLGFERVGSLETNAAVNAPSQLMWLKVSEIRRQIDERASNNCVAGRSLYSHFFLPHEEDDIYARLTGPAATSSVHPRPLLISTERSNGYVMDIATAA